MVCAAVSQVADQVVLCRLHECVGVWVDGHLIDIADSIYGKVHPRRHGESYKKYFETLVDIPEDAKNVDFVYYLVNRANPCSETIRAEIIAIYNLTPLGFKSGDDTGTPQNDRISSS